MKLSILIATIKEREHQFTELYNELLRQSANLDTQVLIDDTEKYLMSIGAKRNNLLKKASGEYIVFFDDDDFPNPNYISSILKALENKPDCVGFKIQMTTNGSNPQTCIHSLQNKKWEFKNGIYLRNVTHFNPVKRELALLVGFPDLRFGEDKIYSDKISKLCKKEVFIDDYLFNYRYSNKINHNEKYGIK